ncbi:PEP-CTERM sorting domain-containing protein, partial [Escherichia coli]|nr:PEP-CTERM sorting domain-containing protein [Escherichia coli]
DDVAIGGRGIYEDSEPFHIVFNYGLSQAQYDAAFLSRVTPAVPEPSSATILALGLGLLALARRRIRS